MSFERYDNVWARSTHDQDILRTFYKMDMDDLTLRSSSARLNTCADLLE